MTDWEPTNAELRLQRLDEQEQQEREQRGILELFDEADEPRFGAEDR